MDPPLLQLGDAKQTPTFVLIGDSHAEASWMGLDAVCREEKISGVFLTSIMIPLWDRYIKISDSYEYNRSKANAFLEWLKSHPEIRTVVIDNLWNRLNDLEPNRNIDWDRKPVHPSFENNAEAFREFCLRVKNTGKDIVIIGPLPVFKTSRIAGYARSLLNEKEHEQLICTHEEFNKLHGTFFDYLKKMESECLCRVIYPHYLYQTGKGYSAIINGLPMFKDADHLSVHGSLFQMKALREDVLRHLKVK